MDTQSLQQVQVEYINDFVADLTGANFIIKAIYISPQSDDTKFIHAATPRKQLDFFIISRNQLKNNYVNQENINLIENDYKSYCQRMHLLDLNVETPLVCTSDRNLCIKLNDECAVYEIDESSTQSVAATVTDELEQLEIDDTADESMSDIEIGDFPIDSVYPMFTYQNFIDITAETVGSTKITNIENIISNIYNNINKGIQNINDSRLKGIKRKFDDMYSRLYREISESYVDIYNLDAEITEYSDKLQKLRDINGRLKESDPIEMRFKTERAITKCKESLATLNARLIQKRNSTNKMINGCYEYIDKFERKVFY